MTTPIANNVDISNLSEMREIESGEIGMYHYGYLDGSLPEIGMEYLDKELDKTYFVTTICKHAFTDEFMVVFESSSGPYKEYVRPAEGWWEDFEEAKK